MSPPSRTPSFMRLLETKGELLPEPILLETAENSRLQLFPIRNRKAYEKFFKKQRDMFWSANEVPLGDDIEDWNNRLQRPEQEFLEKILAFFAGSDAVVNENIVINFYQEVKMPEARLFYAIQIGIEAIHSEMYGILLDTFVSDEDRKLELFSAINSMPTISKKAAWAEKWQDARYSSFAERLVAYAAVEGIFFSGSFCAIFWLTTRNLMPGLKLSNEFISKDEGLHRDFACFLYSECLVNKLPQETIYEIVKEAVEIETEFVCDALPVDMIGMNKELMSIYIKVCANSLVENLGCEKLYPSVSNPFPFMDQISIGGKTNFFEQHVTDYAKVKVSEIAVDFDGIDF